jgi:alpha-1,3-mannosyltransferase
MNITHVVRQFSPSVGGLEDAVLNLCMATQEVGTVKNSVVTLNRTFSHRDERLSDRAKIDGIKVERIGFFGSSRYPLAPLVLRHLRDSDLVHVHGIDFFFDYLAITRRLHAKPMVASTHGIFFHTEFARRLKELHFRHITRRSARAYERIFASSQSDADTFSRVAPHKTITMPNGVDIKKWSNVGSVEPLTTMVYIGRFSENKRIPLLFPVVRELSSTSQKWRLYVVGKESDFTARQLSAIAAQEGLDGQVKIIPNPTKREIAEILKRASYIVSASAYEGFGLSIVEGLSAGLYPLVSSIPAFASLVHSTGRGQLLDFGNPAEAASIIRNKHLSLARAYSAERKQNIIAAGLYDWQSTAARMIEEYRSILDRGPSLRGGRNVRAR